MTLLGETVLIQPQERVFRRDRRLRPIGVGLIGTGAVWERRYRPALSRMAQRLTIRAVYDPVPARAQFVAAEYHATVAASLTQLINRADVQGVLILDPDWMGLVPAEAACQARKPAFLAGSLGDDLEAIQRLHRRAQEHNVLLMTEFSRRHTPASNRLRELTATRLGAVRRISITASLPSPQALPGERVTTDLLVGLLDWCMYITGRIPTSVHAQPLRGESEHAGWKVELGFRRGQADGWSAAAEILLLNTAQAPPHPHPLHRVECERGVASTAQPTEIVWESSQTERTVESLVTDRSEAEVMLDAFCRRVVGGVVPTADMLDVCRGLALARAVQASLQSGRPAEGPWL